MVFFSNHHVFCLGKMLTDKKRIEISIILHVFLLSFGGTFSFIFAAIQNILVSYLVFQILKLMDLPSFFFLSRFFDSA
jgi:hypothetical protein